MRKRNPRFVAEILDALDTGAKTVDELYQICETRRPSDCHSAAGQRKYHGRPKWQHWIRTDIEGLHKQKTLFSPQRGTWMLSSDIGLLASFADLPESHKASIIVALRMYQRVMENDFGGVTFTKSEIEKLSVFDETTPLEPSKAYDLANHLSHVLGATV